MKMYLIGFYYDDFDDGGFEVVGVAHNTKDREKIMKEGQEKYPYLSFGYRTYELNKFQDNHGEEEE